MASSEAAVALLKQVGIARIANFDGCLCSSSRIKGVDIDTACRKSSGSRDFHGLLIRIYSPSLDVMPDDLRMVAEETVSQMRALDERSPMALRYCSFEYDHESKCVYCDKPRATQDAYLCGECLIAVDPFGGSLAEKYDYSRAHFAMPEPIETCKTPGRVSHVQS
jgi:hypothetical protein